MGLNLALVQNCARLGSGDFCDIAPHSQGPLIVSVLPVVSKAQETLPAPKTLKHQTDLEISHIQLPILQMGKVSRWWVRNVELGR